MEWYMILLVIVLFSFSILTLAGLGIIINAIHNITSCNCADTTTTTTTPAEVVVVTTAPALTTTTTTPALTTTTTAPALTTTTTTPALTTTTTVAAVPTASISTGTGTGTGTGTNTLVVAGFADIKLGNAIKINNSEIIVCKMSIIIVWIILALLMVNALISLLVET